MVPAASDGIPPVPPYSGSRFASFPFRLQAFHLLRGAFPGASARFRIATFAALLPRRGLDPRGLGSSAFARHYSRNHSCSLLLPLLRCFSSRRSPRSKRCAAFSRAGFPIRTSADQGPFAPPRGFSQLVTSFIASESHRHPPCALLVFLSTSPSPDGAARVLCFPLRQ